MTREYRYAGPDGAGIAGLPAGVGAVIGSDYCVHLLPGAEELAGAIAAARAREIPLILLTPYFRDAELKKAIGLFRAIPEGADILVAVNDWGALLAVHVLFPRLALSVGRLLSGQKRCPRIGISSRLTEAGRAWHGEGLYASPQVRRFLSKEFGVRGFHVDSLPWGDAALTAAAGMEGEGAVLFVHAPYAVVTISDSCPWLDGKSSASVPFCPRPCRDGAVALTESSMGSELIAKGKARFFRVGDSIDECAEARAGVATVLYEEVP